jgi:hypothetical protein
MACRIFKNKGKVDAHCIAFDYLTSLRAGLSAVFAMQVN